ncbi:hypothetical protein D3C72_490960 [compost metagenome]
MTFRGAPDHAFRPQHQVAQLLDHRMVIRRVIRQWQAGRVEDSRLGTEVLQQAGGFFGQQAAEGAFAGRTIQQQDARLVGGLLRDRQFLGCRQIDQVGVDVGNVVFGHGFTLQGSDG